MIEPKDALDRLRRANLLPPNAKLDDELAATVAECERRIAAERGIDASESRYAGEALRPTYGFRSRWRPALVFSLAFVAVIAVAGVFALFNDSGGVVLESDVANTVARPEPSGTIGNVAYVDDLVYYEDEERTLETSVFFPIEGEGPFPVVVLYDLHQLGSQDRELSRRIADRGAVVFAPVWVDVVGPSLTVSDYIGAGMWNRAACAVGHAQAQAEAYGGDPAQTTVMGAAGGEHPAAWVTLGLADIGDCAEPVRFQPTGLVAGQSQWLFQEPQFDDAFDSEDAGAIDTVDRLFNPAHWEYSEQLTVFLWATAWPGNSAAIDDPPAEDSWIWSRDPDGDIVEDLGEVDAFADGVITFSDNARLMNLRMMQAGIDVSYYESDATGYRLDETAFESIWQVVIGG